MPVTRGDQGMGSCVRVSQKKMYVAEYLIGLITPNRIFGNSFTRALSQVRCNDNAKSVFGKNYCRGRPAEEMYVF